MLVSATARDRKDGICTLEGWESGNPGDVPAATMAAVIDPLVDASENWIQKARALVRYRGRLRARQTLAGSRRDGDARRDARLPDVAAILRESHAAMQIPLAGPIRQLARVAQLPQRRAIRCGLSERHNGGQGEPCLAERQGRPRLTAGCSSTAISSPEPERRSEFDHERVVPRCIAIPGRGPRRLRSGRAQ